MYQPARGLLGADQRQRPAGGKSHVGIGVAQQLGDPGFASGADHRRQGEYRTAPDRRSAGAQLPRQTLREATPLRSVFQQCTAIIPELFPLAQDVYEVGEVRAGTPAGTHSGEHLLLIASVQQRRQLGATSHRTAFAAIATDLASRDQGHEHQQQRLAADQNGERDTERYDRYPP
jgi:hypothetical protein